MEKGVHRKTPVFELFLITMQDVYSKFIQKLTEVLIKVVPVKNKTIKRNSQEWFYNDISEKIIIWDKLFKRSKGFM